MLDAPSALVHYPGIPMARFGSVPAEYGGGNLYRVIWAPSRLVVLTGRDKTMTVPMYCGPRSIEPVGEFWILEGWKSPLDICGPMTAEDWNANPMLLNTGPFPSRGDYVRHETLAVSPSDANIEKLITWIEEGRKRRSVDNAQVCQNNLEQSIKDRKTKRDELIRGSMLPYGGEAMTGYGGGRGTKTVLTERSVEELGLPKPGATAAIRGKRVVYQIEQEY